MEDYKQISFKRCHLALIEIVLILIGNKSVNYFVNFVAFEMNDYEGFLTFSRMLIINSRD